MCPTYDADDTLIGVSMSLSSNHNPNFKVVEFDHFRMNAGLPSFVLSALEWIERTGAVGLIVRKGRYGGTNAHNDIAFGFGSAICVPFKLYMI